MIKLKKLMGEGENKKAPKQTLSNEARRHFLEIISTYGSFGPKLKNENDLAQIAETLGAITDAACEFANKEAGNHFDESTVKRNMNELNKLSSQFEKIANEAKSLQSQMENLYEDMGHIIGRYYGVSELSEEDVNKRLGIRNEKMNPLKESVSHEAMGIASMTNTRKEAVQKFIDDNNLDALEILKVVTKGGLYERVRFIQALVGTPNNSSFKWYVKTYANESVNEVKVIDIVDRFENLKLPNIVYLNKKPFTGKTFVMNGYNGYTSSDTDGLFYDIKTRKPLTDKQGNILRATTHRGAKFDFKDGIKESVNEANDLKVYHKSYTEAIQNAKEYAFKRGYMVDDDDSFRKIGMGPKRPSEGKTNKVSVELTKGGKPSNKQLHIQVYGMKNGYELNCYIG